MPVTATPHHGHDTGGGTVGPVSRRPVGLVGSSLAFPLYSYSLNSRKRTLANPSAFSDEQVGSVPTVLAGVAVRPVQKLFEMVRS